MTIRISKATCYFNDCNEKYLRRFDEITPEGNHIQGWICVKPNKYLGSLLIDTVNNNQYTQFVQSMPKIHYFQHDTDIDLDENSNYSWANVGFEKLDGSCLILYPLLDNDGKIMEIIPKTRGRAVADKYFLDLYNKIDKSNIWDYYRVHKGILFFELYGILNQHEIIHYDTGIDIRLIGEFDDGVFSRFNDLEDLCFLYNFRTPDMIFRINPTRDHRIRLLIPSKKYEWYFHDVPREELIFNSKIECFEKIGELLTYLNKTYLNFYGRLACEGVVINCTNEKGCQKYIKVKPKQILEQIGKKNGIPRSSIRKESLKYLDEYGSMVQELYASDKNHPLEYLMRMLSEEYSIELVNQSKKRIKRVFLDTWDKQQVPISIHKICDDLYDDYGDEGITYCMRMFGSMYPMKKRYSNIVYNILSKKLS